MFYTQSPGDFVNGRRAGVTLFLGDAFELHLSVDGQLSQGETRFERKSKWMISWHNKVQQLYYFFRFPLPFASHSVFVGSELGSYKLWSEEFGFTVSIDSAANVALTLTKRHANNTCGLCGNFNSMPEDEYTAQEGVHVLFYYQKFLRPKRCRCGAFTKCWNLGIDLNPLQEE